MLESGKSETEKMSDFLIKENGELKKKVTYLEEQLKEAERRRKDIENRLVVNAKTGFPNRYQLKRELIFYIEDAKAGNGPGLAIIILKLDKKYDMLVKTMKPSVSEWVLYQTAIRIQEVLSKYDRIYHTQDDEFIIVLRRNQPEQEISKVFMNINDAVIKPHVFSGHHVSIACSAGISLYPRHGEDKGTLLHHADIALESAIRKNKAAEIFKKSLKSDAVERMDLQTNIIQALESQARLEFDKQFELYFQPIVTINGIQGNNIWIDKIDAEVLIRWNHPEKGLIMPDKFIPLAEETGLILPMGSWVLYNVLEQIEKWGDSRFSNISLSVNLSPKQFSDEFVARNILEVIGKRIYEPDRIMLEITENCLMENPLASIEKLKKLQENNIKISVDDFGSGYSSLNYLRLLPVSNIKIDKSFIKNINHSKHDLAIARAIFALGRDLDFHIIAEGVEEFVQIKTAFHEGCRTFQGYYFSKPVPLPEFEALYDKLLEGPVGMKNA